jgi:hypothetical protein
LNPAGHKDVIGDLSRRLELLEKYIGTAADSDPFADQSRESANASRVPNEGPESYGTGSLRKTQLQARVTEGI